ncbi:hypothetical protein GCM10010405_01810 [Streptomyces macrosporus]|uniref:Uncharacterized protein n=1 Tax=Streptomyces macrosporus TaxID=44032 RepID=A0ABP5WA12_9ACTN
MPARLPEGVEHLRPDGGMALAVLRRAVGPDLQQETDALHVAPRSSMSPMRVKGFTPIAGTVEASPPHVNGRTRKRSRNLFFRSGSRGWSVLSAPLTLLSGAPSFPAMKRFMTMPGIRER